MNKTLVDKIKKLLPANRFARSVAIIAGGSVFGQGLTVISSPILTRLYSPNDFGILAVYTAILIMSLNFASLRYEFAIPIAEDDQKAIDLLVLCAGLVVSMSILCSLIILIFYNQLQGIERVRTLQQYIWLLPVGFLCNGCYHVISYWAVRERKYVAISQTKVSQGIASTVTQLGLGFITSGPLGLLVGQIMGQTSGVGTLTRQFWKKSRGSLRLVSFGSVFRAAKRYKEFPLYQSSGTMLYTAGMQVPPLLFAGFYGTKVAGCFYLTQKVLALPISLVGASVSRVFLGEAARISNDPAKLRTLIREVDRKLLLIGIPPCLILAAGGQWIFKIVFGAEWVLSGLFVQVMAFVFLLTLTTESVINFSIIERNDLSFTWALMRLVLVVLAILLAVWLKLSDFWAVTFYSVAMIVTFLAKYVMWNHALRQKAAMKDERDRASGDGRDEAVQGE